MTPQDLVQVVSELSPEEQSVVKAFIAFLRNRKGELSGGAFGKAIEEFIAAHPELLRRLAQ